MIYSLRPADRQLVDVGHRKADIGVPDVANERLSGKVLHCRTPDASRPAWHCRNTAP